MTDNLNLDENLIDYNAQDEWMFESGKMQSPVDLAKANAQPLRGGSPLELDYPDEITALLDTGHGIKAKCDGKAKLLGRPFRLEQFHLHTTGEHALDGKRFPMELHFVHTSQVGRIAVVGVFVQPGAYNPAFQTLLDHIDDLDKAAVIPLEVQRLLPKNRSYFHYLGSLTTPPLTENVEWYLLRQPIELSEEQITGFQKETHRNDRNLQPLNNRVVVVYSEP